MTGAQAANRSKLPQISGLTSAALRCRLALHIENLPYRAGIDTVPTRPEQEERGEHVSRWAGSLTVIGIVAVTSLCSSAIAFASSEKACASPAPSTQKAPLAQAIIATAQGYVGCPYSWTGSTPETGFSCMGLVYYVYTSSYAVTVGTDLVAAYSSAPHVSRADLQPADLVFFSGTVPGMTPLSHVAIYVGNGKMIAADSMQTGVQWDDLTSDYWSSHYVGATRPLAALGGTRGTKGTQPATPSPTAVPATTAVTTTMPAASGEMTVSTDAAQPSMGATAAQGTPLVVRDSALVLRSGPGEGYMAISSLTVGTVLVVVAAADTWYHVSLANDQFGWVSAAGVVTRVNTAPGASSPTATAPVTSSAPGATSAYIGAVRQRMAVSAVMLKLHARPGFTALSVGHIPYGSVVLIKRVQRDWDMVQLANGRTGWVYSHYLSADLGLAAKAGAVSVPTGMASTTVKGFKQTSSYRVVTVRAGMLIVRAAPSTNARIVTQVAHGERLRVIRTRPGWCQVVMRGGRTGWVSARGVG